MNSPNFCDVQNIKFGFMQIPGELKELRKETIEGNRTWRECPGKPLLFDPKAVEVAIDLNTNANASTPVIYDLKEDRFIWIDKGIEISNGGPINMDNPQSVNANNCILYKALHNGIPTMKQLFEIQAMANGQLTTDISQADTIFTDKPTDFAEIELKKNARVITAYDLSIIASDFMTKAEEKTKIIKEHTKEKKHNKVIEEYER